MWKDFKVRHHEITDHFQEMDCNILSLPNIFSDDDRILGGDFFCCCCLYFIICVFFFERSRDPMCVRSHPAFEMLPPFEKFASR